MGRILTLVGEKALSKPRGLTDLWWGGYELERGDPPAGRIGSRSEDAARPAGQSTGCFAQALCAKPIQAASVFATALFDVMQWQATGMDLCPWRTQSCGTTNLGFNVDDDDRI
jgi:hypothetical protein